jgi:hypothetical protein
MNDIDQLSIPNILIPDDDHDLIVKNICNADDLELQSVMNYVRLWRILCAILYRFDPALLLTPPQERLNPISFALVLMELTARLQPADVLVQLGNLKSCAKRMFPEADWSFVVAAMAAYRAGARAAGTLAREKKQKKSVTRDALRGTPHQAALAALAAAQTRYDGELAKTSPNNIDGDYRRFLGELKCEGVECLNSKPRELLTLDNLRIYQKAIHSEKNPSADIARLNALAFAFRHLADGVDLAVFDSLKQELRKKFGMKTRPPSFPWSDVPAEERRRLEQSFFKQEETQEDDVTDDPDDDQGADEPSDDESADELNAWFAALGEDAPVAEQKKSPEMVVRPDTAKGLRLALRGLTRVLRENAPHLAAQHVDKRDYVEVAEIFESTLYPRRPRAVAYCLQRLCSVLQRICPGQSFRFLKRRVSELKKIEPKDAVDSPELELPDLGETAMAIMRDSFRRLCDLAFCKNPYRDARELAETYRNALVLAILAEVPLRLRTLSMLIGGETLVWVGANYAIDAPAEIMKNKEPYYGDLSPHLNIWISRYRFFVREFIKPKSKCADFWLSRNGCALDRSAYQRIVPRIILARHGIKTSCHKLRNAYATQNIEKDPAVVAAGMQHNNLDSLAFYQGAKAHDNLSRGSAAAAQEADAFIRASLARKLARSA